MHPTLPGSSALVGSLHDWLDIIERVHARGAMIKVLDKPHLDLTTPIGRGVIAFLSALAEDERHYQACSKAASASCISPLRRWIFPMRSLLIARSRCQPAFPGSAISDGEGGLVVLKG